MKVLVTGATGFIGSALVKHLLSNNIEVITIGRNLESVETEHIVCDLLLNPPDKYVLNKLGASHLVHLAWYTEPADFWDAMINFKWAEASIKLIDSFYNAGGKHAVFGGSCAEYSWDNNQLSEEQRDSKPDTYYGKSKLMVTHNYLNLDSVYNTMFTNARIFFPFGKGERQEKLIPSLLRTYLQDHEKMKIDTNAIRDFVYVTDVVTAIEILIRNNAHGIFNICNSEPISLKLLADFMDKITNRSKSNSLVAIKEGYLKTSVITGDNAKMCALGWKPQNNIFDYMQSTMSQRLYGQ